MKLERMVLRNFRQYYGEQMVEFARSSDRSVTVIHGINGAGKTSFFLGMNWCLYGTKVDDIIIIDNIGQLISKEAVNQAKPGDTVSTEVELRFTHNGERYVVRRKLKGLKQSDNTLLVDDYDEFMMQRIGADGQAFKISNPIGMMNAILPANVREYFLFDGEKIDNFAKPQSAEQVREAIYLVLNIEILERAHRHLSNSARDYRKKLKQVSSDELGALIEQLNEVVEKRDRAVERQSELKQSIKLAEEKVAEIEDRLRQIQNVKSLQEKRERLEKDVNRNRKELEEIKEEIAKQATSAYPALAIPAIQVAMNMLDEKRSRGEIPSGIRQQFIQDLLAEMVCICGRPFSEHGSEHSRLLSLLNHSMPGSIEDEIMNTHVVLGIIPSECRDQIGQIDRLMTKRTALIEYIQQLEGELDDLGRQLKDSPLEEVSQLERKRGEFKADVDNYLVEIGSLSTSVQECSKDIDDLEKSITKARKQATEEQILSLKSTLAQRAADAINEIYHAFADEKRKEVEAETRKIFKTLVWKDSHFQDVKLDPDFNLDVIDRYGKSARPELSAGERQVLSLSFIAAMAKISEDEAPLVIDTPFGRLSSHHRNSITENLPKLAHQLILFVTDEELRDEARANLEPYIGAEYRLEFDRMTSCTEIVEI